MASKLGLYNEAMLILGQERLASLTEASTARYALDDVYTQTLNYCLERGYWNFAMRTVLINHDTSIAPAFGWTYAFSKPDDWIQTYIISDNERFDPPLNKYNDEGAYWWADSDPLYVRYVSNDSSYGLDLSGWSQSFADYVASRLASKTCKRITGDDPKPDMVKAEREAMVLAKSKDAMAEPPAFPPRNTWSLSRRGNSTTRWDGTIR